LEEAPPGARAVPAATGRRPITVNPQCEPLLAGAVLLRSIVLLPAAASAWWPRDTPWPRPPT